MATLTKTQALGSNGDYSSANVADLTMTAGDVGGDQFVGTGRDLVVVRNSGGSTYYVTITSVADPHYGREGDVDQYDIGAGEIAVFGPFKRPGWVNSSGYIEITVENAALLVGIVALPA